MWVKVRHFEALLLLGFTTIYRRITCHRSPLQIYQYTFLHRDSESDFFRHFGHRINASPQKGNASSISRIIRNYRIFGASQTKG